jgi:hypothetical protein
MKKFIDQHGNCFTFRLIESSERPSEYIGNLSKKLRKRDEVIKASLFQAKLCGSEFEVTNENNNNNNNNKQQQQQQHKTTQIFSVSPPQITSELVTMTTITMYYF